MTPDFVVHIAESTTLGPRRRHPTGYVRASLGRSCNDTPPPPPPEWGGGGSRY